MKFFERYDERSQAIEDAGGNRAFKVLWILLSIGLFFMFFEIVETRGSTFAKIMALYFIISMISVLCLKYYYCWKRNVDKKLLIAKFIGSFLYSFLFIILASIVAVIFLRIF